MSYPFYDKKLWDQWCDRDKPPYFGKAPVPAILKSMDGDPSRINHWFSQGLDKDWRIYAFGNTFELNFFLAKVKGSVECDREGEEVKRESDNAQSESDGV